MNKISKTLKIQGLSSILLWILGSIVLFNKDHGNIIIVVTGVIIIAGLYSQIIKEKKTDYEHRQRTLAQTTKRGAD